jgi:hypothetical protein
MEQEPRHSYDLQSDLARKPSLHLGYEESKSWVRLHSPLQTGDKIEKDRSFVSGKSFSNLDPPHPRL